MRPALLDALAVVSPFDLRRSDYLTRHRVYVEAGRVGVALDHAESRLWHRWSQASPADAVAALAEAELLPAHWCDTERAPRWWCRLTDTGSAWWEPIAPPSVADLLAVASLGANTIARAEELAADVWRARVVWRVAPAATLRELMEQAYDEGAFGAGVLYVAAVAWFHPDDVADALAWWREHDPAQEKAARAVADLAALGLHVVAVDDERVTLAVESV